ncbi:hypothetical protein ACFL4C_01475 [Candidatus Omnitrophota bacterium]
MMEMKSGYHKRNRIIVTSLLLARILSGWSLGFILGFFKIVETHEEMINIQIGLNFLLGILFIIVFIWYAFTLDFKKKWWIFPTIIMVGFLSLYLGWLPWAVLLALFYRRSRELLAIQQ